MHKLLGTVAISALLLTSGAAYADMVKGVIENLGEGAEGPTVTISGTEYTIQDTALDSLKDLKAGDEVQAEFTESDGMHWISNIGKAE